MSDTTHSADSSYPATISAQSMVPRAAIKALKGVLRYFDVSLEGADNLPEGGALLVGNHSHFGIDSLAFFPALHRETGRVPRGMALRSLFEVPGLPWLMHQLGAVRGTREACVGLLRAGELVVTYPGGARDSIKGRGERYQLKWGARSGFAEAAIRARTPIVPFAAIGPDEVFPVLNKRGLVSAPFLGDKSYKVPLVLPLARRVPFRFYVGEPIAAPDVAPDAAPERRLALQRELAERARGGLEALIDRGLAERAEAQGERPPTLRSMISSLLP